MNPHSPEPEAADDLQARLAQIERLLASDPARADAQLAELLVAHPAQPTARLLQAIARRLTGRPADAVEMLTSLSRDWPDSASAHLQLGLALREAGRSAEAVHSMRRAVGINPEFNDAWRALADLLVASGDAAGADAAYSMYIRQSARDPRLLEPAAALRTGRTAQADALLRRHLEQHPNDVAAMCMLAEVAARAGRTRRAAELLRRCLDLAPGYTAARHNYAVALMQRNEMAAALREAERLSTDEPGNTGARHLMAALHLRCGDYEQAISVYRTLIEESPDDAGIWMSLGHALRTVGRRDECEAAYRKAIALAPHFGEAYWSLANLKLLRFSSTEIEAMQAQLRRPDLSDEDRVHFLFALAKASQDRGDIDESFRQYTEANRIRRRNIRHDPAELDEYVRRSRVIFTREFFEQRAGSGADARDPIFIVGMPRSGSTLVEQILSSHSSIEGTMELPEIMGLAQSLDEDSAESGGSGYPEALLRVDQEAWRSLGERYLDQTRIQRKRRAPHFIDKMPNNFAHVGFMHLILPRARIIDVRRHPMACGLSIFRHLFARGQNFSYSLEDIGAHYRGYVELMAHFDAVLPGRVHRVHYEDLVQDTETEVRRLLEYCGLLFEEGCLRFYENRRAVSTPSSEQVRTPMFAEGIDDWRRYQAWLAPLRAALGPVADLYPRVPAVPARGA